MEGWDEGNLLHIQIQPFSVMEMKTEQTKISNIKDAEGKYILESIAVAKKFNKWMYSQISYYLKDPAIEIGSGIGNISTLAVNDLKEVTLSDYNQEYCNLLLTRFENHTSVKSILTIDLLDPDFERTYLSLKGKYSSIFMLNVLEHIPDEGKAMRNCSFLLAPGGTIAILVPAYMSLFSPVDVTLGHCRRYSKKMLKKTVTSNGFSISRIWHFNFLGMMGWFMFCKLLRRRIITTGQTRTFEWLIPVAKILDIFFLNKVGLSVICVAQKQ